MYPFLHELLSDKKGGVTFSCFDFWHWCYILLTFAVMIALFLVLRKKDRKNRERALDLSIGFAFSLYIADFFLMPLAYGSIDIEKLPFHVCTAMCVMCFWSRRSHRLEAYRMHFALLGFLSNLVYLIYPAGVMWHQVHPLSYRVVQTLLFHGAMTIHGFLTLVFGGEGFNWKHCRRDLVVILGMTAWAMFGNALYGGYSSVFNWFFVLRHPFYLLPEKIAPFVMPVVNVILFFGAEMIVYGITSTVRTQNKLKKTAL